MLALLLHVAHAVYLRRQLPVIYHHLPHHRHHDTVLVEGTAKGSLPSDDSGLFQGANEVQSTGRLAGVQSGAAFQEEATMQQGQVHTVDARRDDVVRAAPIYPAVYAVPPAPPAEGVEEYDDADSDANELLTADNAREALTREDEMRINLARARSEPVATEQEVSLPAPQEPRIPPTQSQIPPQQPPSMPQLPPAQVAYPQRPPPQMQYPQQPALPMSQQPPQPYPPQAQPVTLTNTQTEQMPLPVEPQTTLPGSVPGPMPAAAVAMSHVQPAVATAPVKSRSVTRPKGWDQCLIFARYIKSQDVVGQEFIRTWKSTCQPAVQSGAATERYRLMCNALTGAVEPYAAQADYDIEQLCDSVLAVFHDVTAL
eukprot:GEMP01038564.1.p1 GENE.GEMP01038564.1~~GEMP01038564.1.p1  ORF type:complete len:370 (+),score=108.82 GEMP01038564.1:108-1217(+)